MKKQKKKSGNEKIFLQGKMITITPSHNVRKNQKKLNYWDVIC